MISFKKQKYSAIKVHHAGHSFASKLEAAVYNELLLREIAGEIKDIQCQDHVYLTNARICYISDFKFLDLGTNTFVWAEAKGMETPVWKIKKKLWKHYGPGRLEIYTGSHKSYGITETIIPKF